MAAVFVGLAAATKQYLVLALPLAFLLDDARGSARWRLPLIASGVAGLAILPGFAADPSGFVHSAVLVQVREELRMDALSLAVPYAALRGAPLPGVLYGLIVLTAAALSAWRAPRTPAGFSAALAVTLFTAFAFGKKAFCNYYVFVIAAMVMAVATWRAKTPGEAPSAAAGPTVRPA
jgi:uncharacterized membrane protein